MPMIGQQTAEQLNHNDIIINEQKKIPIIQINIWLFTGKADLLDRPIESELDTLVRNSTSIARWQTIHGLIVQLWQIILRGSKSMEVMEWYLIMNFEMIS